ncbi:MAG: TraR/DksA family transcriptional regulator [Acidimicrobiales bacterium]|jgi:DnaK suppressor protein
MDKERAGALLEAERARVEQLLAELTAAAEADEVAAGEDGDMADPAEPLTSAEGAEAVAAGLRDRLAAIARAEARLAAGTYGRSVESGQPIPDDRLAADPAAELTLEEAERAEAGGGRLAR